MQTINKTALRKSRLLAVGYWIPDRLMMPHDITSAILRACASMLSRVYVTIPDMMIR
ncbi:MAG: hypothetical protein WAQ09_00855 [Bacillota bacterium]